MFGCNQREQRFNSKIQTLFFELNPYQSLLELVRKILILDFISGFVLPTYLTTLGILAIYGLHRYQLIYLYFKNRNNKQPKFIDKFDTTTILPLAGRGSRFSKVGYDLPKEFCSSYFWFHWNLLLDSCLVITGGNDS